MTPKITNEAIGKEPFIQANPAGPEDEALWRDFVEKSPNGVFYQDMAFSNIYAWKVKRTANLLFRRGSEIIAVMTAGVSEAEGIRELRSPFSSSFGGFAVGRKFSLTQALGVIEALEDWARSQEMRKIVLQQPPVIYSEGVDETIEFALRYRGFRESGVELSFYLNSINAVSEVVLRNWKKACHAGCRFRETDQLGEVWDFLSQVKAERQQPFDIRRQDLLAIRDAFPGRVIAFEVIREDRRAAAMIAYRLNGWTMLGFHWGQLSSAQQYRCSDFLILEAVRWALGRGYRRFDLGTTTLGGEPVWGVTHFKEKFRPLGVLRRRFSKNLS